MNHEHDTFGMALTKAFAWITAWIGTVSIADVQPYVSVASGSLVGLLALVNIIKALWPKKESK